MNGLAAFGQFWPFYFFDFTDFTAAARRWKVGQLAADNCTSETGNLLAVITVVDL